MTAFALGLIGDPLGRRGPAAGPEGPRAGGARARGGGPRTDRRFARRRRRWPRPCSRPLPPKAPAGGRARRRSGQHDRSLAGAADGALRAGAPQGRAQRAGGAPLRRQAAVRLVGRHLDGDAPRERGPASRPARRHRLHRSALARLRRARPGRPQGCGETSTRCSRSCATATRRWSSTPCARRRCWARRAPCRAVSALLRSPRPALRVEALSALAVLPPDRGLRERMLAEVGSTEPRGARGRAAGAGPHRPRASSRSSSRASTPIPRWFVRAALADALAELGDEASQAGSSAMLKDEDAARPARGAGGHAQGARRRRGGHPAAPSRAPGLRGARGRRRRAGGAEGRPGSRHAGRRCWTRARGDVDIDARLALVDALAACRRTSGRAGPAARGRARRSGPRRARARALAPSSRRSGEARPTPGRGRRRRPSLDYREASRALRAGRPDVPLFTPRAFLHTRARARSRSI